MGSPAIWSVSGTAPLDFFEDGVHSVYEGFVFEQVSVNDSIQVPCGVRDRTTFVIWRTLADSSGIHAVGAWAPPPPGPQEFPLGQPVICGSALKPTPAAWARDIAGGSPLSSPVQYRSRSGVMRYERDSLARGKPCPQPPTGYLSWLPGTCLQFTYTVTLTAIMERRGESAASPGAEVISFSARLPGIRVTVDCATQGPLMYACLRARTSVPCQATTVASDGRSATYKCVPPTRPREATGKQ